MKILSRHGYASLVWGLGGAFALNLAVADPPAASTPPDTSDWKCTQCPFLQGYEGEAEAGALNASGANASYGRYTGIDHSGTYADVGASAGNRR